MDDTQVGQIKVGDQVTIQAGSSTATVYGTVSSVGLVAQSSRFGRFERGVVPGGGGGDRNPVGVVCGHLGHA